MSLQELKANFIDAVKNHYADFKGQAEWKSLGMFLIVDIAIGIVLSILSFIPFLGVVFSILNGLLGLALLCPFIALIVRCINKMNAEKAK